LVGWFVCWFVGWFVCLFVTFIILRDTSRFDTQHVFSKAVNAVHGDKLDVGISFQKMFRWKFVVCQTGGTLFQ